MEGYVRAELNSYRHMDPYGFGGDSMGWANTFSESSCLEELQSGDEMRIYSAILELSRTLSMAQENTMNSFSTDSYVQVIINIINTPSYSDISNETACKYKYIWWNMEISPYKLIHTTLNILLSIVH